MTSPFDESPSRAKSCASRRRKAMSFGKSGIAVIGKDLDWRFPTGSGSINSDALDYVAWNSSNRVNTPTMPKEDLSSRQLHHLEFSNMCGHKDCTRGFEQRLHEVPSGQGWTIAICSLFESRDADGITASLGVMENVVLDMGQSELARAGVDFERVIREKRAAYPHIFVSSGEPCCRFNYSIHTCSV